MTTQQQAGPEPVTPSNAGEPPSVAGFDIGSATRRGVREHNMDAAAVFEASTGTIAAAVVDGIGNHADGPAVMALCAQSAVRTAATIDSGAAMAGVLTAAAMIRDPGVGEYRPNAVMVLAVTRPDDTISLGWVGDSHVYGWDGHTLRRRTDPHTMGAFLRWNDEDAQAPQHDNWVRVSLSNALPTNVALSEAPAGETLLLVSDGLDEAFDDGTIESLLLDRPGLTAQEMADLVADQAREDETGYRDDATCVVLAPAQHREGERP